MTAQHQLQFPACAPHDWILPEIGDVRLECRWCGAESSPLRRWPSYQVDSVVVARRTADREEFAAALEAAWIAVRGGAKARIVQAR